MRLKGWLEGGLRLWVDALCINQDDVNERNWQLKQINTIYAKAQSVHVWLGQSEDGITAGGHPIECLVRIEQDIREEEQSDSLEALNGRTPLAEPFQYMEYAIDEHEWPALPNSLDDHIGDVSGKFRNWR